jgi:hypothetical protein
MGLQGAAQRHCFRSVQGSVCAAHTLTTSTTSHTSRLSPLSFANIYSCRQKYTNLYAQTAETTSQLNTRVDTIDFSISFSAYILLFSESDGVFTARRSWTLAHDLEDTGSTEHGFV